MTSSAPAWLAADVALVPVPVDLVPDVARYVAARAGRATAPGTTPEPGTTPARTTRVGTPAVTGSAPADDPKVVVPDQGSWDREMVNRLADSLTYPDVVFLLDLCAARPGQWVLKADAEAAGGLSAIQLRNELGALTKKTRKLFGQSIWPMEYKKERGAFSYRMGSAVAAWWQDARAGQASATHAAQPEPGQEVSR